MAPETAERQASMKQPLIRLPFLLASDEHSRSVIVETTDKMEAQIEKMLATMEKRGFKRVGDTFYSPRSLLPILDGRPPWAEQQKQFSRVRSFLFVL
jgi:hypothetical protein